MENERVKSLLKSLRTCRGQLDGIVKMVEEARDPLEVSNQILAAQALLKRANKLVLIQHIEKTLHDATPDSQDAAVLSIGPVLEKLLNQP